MNRLYTIDEIIQIAHKAVAILPSQATYLCDLAPILSGHLRRANLITQGFTPSQLPAFSALIVAPTGTGKTYLLKQLTRRLGINLIVLDCSSLAREGWKGTSIAQQLIAARDGIEDDVFANSIVYLDEFDKLRNWGCSQDQGSPIDNLLKLMEEPTVTAEVNREITTVDIRKMTFLFGGAFQSHHLCKIISDRVCPKTAIGFSANQCHSLNEEELLRQVTMEDIAAYGFPMELCGRIGTILTIDQLNKEDYRQLLTSPNGSVLSKYDTFLRHSFGVTLDITDQAVDAITQQAMTSNTGARSITPLVDKLMRTALAQVERDASIGKVLLDENSDGFCFVRYIHNPRQKALDDRPFFDFFQNRNKENIVLQLCQTYSVNGGDPQLLPLLEAYLKCALYYLQHFSLPEDFCWHSLERLTDTLSRSKGGSTWDVLMEDAATSQDFHADTLCAYYQQFLLLYREASYWQIREALTLIRRNWCNP